MTTLPPPLPTQPPTPLDQTPTETTPPPPSGPYWRKRTRDRWFYGYLVASLVAVCLLILPFAGALLFAATTVAVTWGWYERMVHRCGGRRVLAAVLTELLVILVVLGPIAVLGVWFVQQAVVAIQQVGAWLAGGELQHLLDQVANADLPGRDGWGPWVLGTDSRQEALMQRLGESVLGLGQLLGAALPDILGSLLSTVINVGLYLFAVGSLYVQGPRVARAAMLLSPMDDAYERRLFAVFREFSNNLIVGALGTAAVQGLVAAVGYAIAGVDKLVLVSILTGVLSFFPVIGTALVWIPVALWVGWHDGVGWGVFLVLWNLGLTSTVDNVVRPIFMRGRSDIHPLVIFLAVLGGIAWLGVPGVLVGPVVAAVFLALYTIYRSDFLGLPERDPTQFPPAP
ncbi:MAG: AI-2E family transporter [Myxococcota bacterium]